MMAAPEFSPQVRATLDSYAVPPLPAGFADRLLARIDAGDMTTDAPAANLASRFRRGGGGAWRRSGRIIGSVAFLSLATATAAAAGFFGNPLYVPGVSEVLAKTELVPSPRTAAPDRPSALASQKPAAVIEPVQTPPAGGTEAVVSRIEAMRADPRFENLSPRQKLVITRKEVRTMVRSGEVSRQEARTAVRTLVQNADPETRAKWREAATARRDVRLERRAQVTPAPTEGGTVITTAQEPEGATVTDALPPVADSDSSPEKAEALRDRYRDASPAQRAEVRRALRERRSIRQQRRP